MMNMGVITKHKNQVTEGDINFSSKIAQTYMPILKSRKSYR